MAWVDDRLWAHPKVVPLSTKAKWVYVSSILYSHGFGLYGHLKREHQKAIGATAAVRNELVGAGLWDVFESKTDSVFVHDWDEHNGERDRKIEQRRAADRERKRAEREARKRLEQALTPEMSARTSGGSHADSPADVAPDVTAMSTRAGAGARLVTSDEVTNTSQSLSHEESLPANDDWLDDLDPEDATRLEAMHASGAG